MVDLTPTESNLFQSMILHMEKPSVNVDWDEVAADLKYKSGGVAKQRFNQIMKKLKKEASPSKTGKGSGDNKDEYPGKVTKRAGGKPAQKRKDAAKAAPGKKSDSENEKHQEKEDTKEWIKEKSEAEDDFEAEV